MNLDWVGLNPSICRSTNFHKPKRGKCYFTKWNKEIRKKQKKEMTSNCLFPNPLFLASTDQKFGNRPCPNPLLHFQNRSSFQSHRISFPIRAVTAMEAEQSGGTASIESGSAQSMKLLFVEMGVGYDQHGCVFLYSD